MDTSPEPTVPADPAFFRDAPTQALLQRLTTIKDSGKTLFGMANANTISYTKGFSGPPDWSDCQAVTGSHPAFVEDDFMWFIDTGNHATRDRTVVRKRHLDALRAAHARGAVTGYCWHLGGQQSGSFRQILDWGPQAGTLSPDHDLARRMVAQYRSLKAAATSAGIPGTPPATPGTTPGSSCSAAFPPVLQPEAGTPLAWFLGLLDTLVVPAVRELGFPLVFRPFHEMNGSWFWWGSDAIKPDEYHDIYRLTVDHLRARGVRNLIYAFSPNAPFSPEYYPGDAWVDLIGLDSYEPACTPDHTPEMFLDDLRALDAFATAHGKLAALTETGCRKDGEVHRYPQLVPDFWSRCVLGGIKASGARLVWAMSWYQSDFSRQGQSQFYIPYPGIETAHSRGREALEDFRTFARDATILLEDGLARF